MPISQYSKKSWHCTVEVISHISKYSVFPMLRINSFDFSLNRLNFRFLSKSAISDSRPRCVSNRWISFLTVSLRMSSCFEQLSVVDLCILKFHTTEEIHINYIQIGGANTQISTVDGADAVGSFIARSTVPSNITVPLDGLKLTYTFLRMSASL